jgi:hypothetical protein
MKNLFFFIIFLSISSCGEEMVESSTCADFTLTNEYFDINENSICYNWFGSEEVDIKIKRKDGSGTVLERTLKKPFDNCISGIDTSSEFIVSIYKRCYRNYTFEPQLYRTIEIGPVYSKRLQNVNITSSLNRDFLKFDEIQSATKYNFKAKQINLNNFFFGDLSINNSFEINLPTGHNYEINIRPVYEVSYDYSIHGRATKINYNLESILSSELPTPANVSCLPIVCDTSNLGININPGNIVQKLKYFENEASTCEIYYYKIIYKNEPPIEFHLTTLKDKNGKLKIYFRDEYCGKLNSNMEFDGSGILSKKFGNDYIYLTFYKAYFDMTISKDVSIFRKRVK